MRSSFGYAIDYTAAITEDRRVIGECDRALAGGWIAPAGAEYCTLLLLASLVPSVASSIGLDRLDLACAACVQDWSLDALDLSGLDALSEATIYARGKCAITLADQLYCGDLLGSIDALRQRRTRAVASLGRHTRNSAKFRQ